MLVKLFKTRSISPALLCTTLPLSGSMADRSLRPERSVADGVRCRGVQRRSVRARALLRPSTGKQVSRHNLSQDLDLCGPLAFLECFNNLA